VEVERSLSTPSASDKHEGRIIIDVLTEIGINRVWSEGTLIPQGRDND